MTSQPLETVYSALPPRVRKMLEGVRKIAPHIAADKVHLSGEEWVHLQDAVAAAQKNDKIDREIRMEYAGKRLVRWEEEVDSGPGG